MSSTGKTEMENYISQLEQEKTSLEREVSKHPWRVRSVNIPVERKFSKHPWRVRSVNIPGEREVSKHPWREGGQ